METKRPPRVSDPETSNAVNQIYDDLNAIANAVGTGQGQTHKEGSSTEGEIGDIKIGRARLGKYAVMAKTEDGWVESDELSFRDEKEKGSTSGDSRPFGTPTYDSGWVYIETASTPNDGNNYEFTHGLGTKMLLLQLYIKHGDDIFPAVDILTRGGDWESGLSVYMKTDDIIEVGTGNDGIFVHDNTSLDVEYVSLSAGYLRILAWEIGVSV